VVCVYVLEYLELVSSVVVEGSSVLECYTTPLSEQLPTFREDSNVFIFRLSPSSLLVLPHFKDEDSTNLRNVGNVSPATTPLHIPEHLIPQQHRCENLKFRNRVFT
jgi:hypothetical protein